ncbi:copper chaperone PCu(A)C [Vitreimonas sp.]|jgi:copper(I)-binding protein|uniref:copper chaperone PCu(A)C n=1 Tax=Vitreimonas sp. TaxID=3069702 RepID=UPI002ED81C4C
MKKLLAVCALALVAACGQQSTTEPTVPPTETQAPTIAIEIVEPWAGQTPGGVDVSAGYLTIRNRTETDDQLIAVSSPRAARAEIHEMSMDENNVMRMRPLTALTIPAGGEALLQPGGQHLMFFGVTQPFTVGEEIPVQLTFANAGVIDVNLQVRTGAMHGGDH